MKSVFLIFCFFISLFDCLRIVFDYKCDFKFGDPSWNYSTEFYNREFHMEPDSDHFVAYLDKSQGHMIDFVCVNLRGTPKRNAIVDFHPITSEVSVDLKRLTKNGVNVHIWAKQHGY